LQFSIGFCSLSHWKTSPARPVFFRRLEIPWWIWIFEWWRGFPPNYFIL
jgi:hypothetical protein